MQNASCAWDDNYNYSNFIDKLIIVLLNSSSRHGLTFYCLEIWGLSEVDILENRVQAHEIIFPSDFVIHCSFYLCIEFTLKFNHKDITRETIEQITFRVILTL